MSDLLGWLWNADRIAALATSGTLFVAILVFLEARSIRRTEWILRQNQAWSDLNYAIAQMHEGCRIAELLMGDPITPPPTAKEATLLMSYFNVVSSEYHAYRARAIERSYVVHSLTMTSRIAKNNKDWIFDFLLKYGYRADYIRAIAVVVVMGDDVLTRDVCLRRELAAMTRVGRFCGPRYRAWLRREFDNAQIDALCGLPAT